MFRCVALAACLLTSAAQAAPSILAPPTAPGAATLPYVKTKAPVIVLRHVRIIDGTGAAAQEDRTVILKDGQDRRRRRCQCGRARRGRGS